MDKVSNSHVLGLLGSVFVEQSSEENTKEAARLAINLIQVQENRIIEQDKFREDVGFKFRGEDNYPLRMENKELKRKLAICETYLNETRLCGQCIHTGKKINCEDIMEACKFEIAYDQ